MANELATIEIEANGIVKCSNLEQMLSYGAMLVRSGLVPATLNTPEKVVIAAQYGASMGLSLVQSLRSVAVIQNKPAVYGEAVPGICLPSGLIEQFEEHIEKEGSEDMVAVCTLKRKGLDTIRVDRFSVADAKLAGLWKKSGPWTQYPKDMLKYKARARGFKALFADLLCGLGVYEDLQDIPAERETRIAPKVIDPLLQSVAQTPLATQEKIIDAAFTEPAKGMTEVRGAIDKFEEGKGGRIWIKVAGLTLGTKEEAFKSILFDLTETREERIFTYETVGKINELQLVKPIPTEAAKTQEA